MADPVFVVGARVASLPDPYVPSVQVRCHLCGEAVWLSRLSDKFIREKAVAGIEVRPTCQLCAPGLIALDEDPVIRAVPGAIEEARDAIRRRQDPD